jgi:hypothetical protein
MDLVVTAIRRIACDIEAWIMPHQKNLLLVEYLLGFVSFRLSPNSESKEPVQGRGKNLSTPHGFTAANLLS